LEGKKNPSLLIEKIAYDNGDYGKLKGTNSVTKSFVSKVGELLTVRSVALVLAALGLLIAIGGSLYEQNTMGGVIKAFYANASSELISIALTVLVIDWLYDRHDKNQKRTDFIRQMGSRVNEVALEAVEHLRISNWLTDGSLRGAVILNGNLEGVDLREADLREASLNRANLKGADLNSARLQGARFRGAILSAKLHKADLQDADLSGADLQNAELQMANLSRTVLKGANLRRVNLQGVIGLTDEQLVSVSALQGAVMTDGAYYDGRYNLPTDLALLENNAPYDEELRIKFPNYAGDYKHRTLPQEYCADFYRVPLKDYLRGQQWARENLP
jgi:hypothetical protein